MVSESRARALELPERLQAADVPSAFSWARLKAMRLASATTIRQRGETRKGIIDRLALPQKFLLQIDDLADVVIRMAGAGQKLPEPGPAVGAIGKVWGCPIASPIARRPR